MRRTLKELKSYERELEDNRAKVEEIRRGDDHSMLKQWQSVVSETQGMIPDTRGRLATAVDDLSTFVVSCTPQTET